LSIKAFIGFDAIATTGEEAKNPKRAIPISIICSLGLICLAYIGISCVQTLIYPYYLQSDDITHGAPLPYIFDQLGWVWAKWVVTVGALSGLSTCLLGAMYPLPRILYAMASDGIIFRFLSKVHPRFQTPLFATLVAGLLTAIMTSLFNITELVDMMSIGSRDSLVIKDNCNEYLCSNFDKFRNTISVLFGRGIYSYN
jgi:amino acid transporter